MIEAFLEENYQSMYFDLTYLCNLGNLIGHLQINVRLYLNKQKSNRLSITCCCSSPLFVYQPYFVLDYNFRDFSVN